MPYSNSRNISLRCVMRQQRAQDKQYCITGGDRQLYLATNAALSQEPAHLFERCISRRMRRDGRVAFGNAFVNCTLNCTSKNIYLLLSAEKPDAPVHKNAITSLCARTARAKANCSHRQICPQTLDGSLC